MNPESDYWKLSGLRLDPYDDHYDLVTTLQSERIGRFTLYIKPPDKPDDYCFSFICTEIVCEDGVDTWVLVVAYGNAYHDGIRHIRFAADRDPEMIGYFNYPDMYCLGRLMKRLRELEIQYCAPWETENMDLP